MPGLNYGYWKSRLTALEKDGLAPAGYHLLYGPWESLAGAEVAFLSANPGRRVQDGRDSMVSDERGNSYEVEKHTTLSPLTAQFLKMCQFNGWSPARVVTGVANPLRTPRERDLTKEQRTAGYGLALDFWTAVFAANDLRMVVCCSTAAIALVKTVTAARELDVLPTGWGNTSIRRFTFGSGSRIIQLPHLSNFKLFSREECRTPLETAFAG